jgi:ribose-phosphate pyrophosphokinase
MAKKQKKAILFSGRATRYLAEKIAENYGEELGKMEVTEFADGEFRTAFEDNIRGKDVFLIQSTFSPSDNLFELLMMADAAKRASARKIVAVIPYFGFARQDRKDKPRVPITAKLIAKLLVEAGIKRLVTIDLHADQIQGFFDIPVDHLYASSIFIPHLRTMNLENVVLASPDTGGTRRAASYAKKIKTDFVICYKQRSVANVVDTMKLIGNVEGKDVILLDDIVDTAGSITKAAELMIDNGAKSVRAFITHPVLSRDAVEKIRKSVFVEFFVTDTIPLSEKALECDKIKVLSTAPLFAEVINRVMKAQSITGLFR